MKAILKVAIVSKEIEDERERKRERKDVLKAAVISREKSLILEKTYRCYLDR